jgi:hypothetical protein
MQGHASQLLICVAHTKEQLDKGIEAFLATGKELGVI